MTRVDSPKNDAKRECRWIHVHYATHVEHVDQVVHIDHVDGVEHRRIDVCVHLHFQHRHILGPLRRRGRGQVFIRDVDENGIPVPGFNSLSDTPYVEVGYGIENIFKVLKLIRRCDPGAGGMPGSGANEKSWERSWSLH